MERQLSPSPSTSPSTTRVIVALEALAANPGARHIDLVSRTGISHATLHRVLAALVQSGYVVRDQAGDGYRITDRIQQLFPVRSENDQLLTAATAVADAFMNESGETVHVAALRENRLLYLYKRESTQPLRVSMSSREGALIPFHCTALGKAVLAALKGPQQETLLETLDLVRYTRRTIVDRTTLRDELRAIALRGYAVDDEEHEMGIRCIASVIRGSDSLPIAAISVSIPSVRCPRRGFPEWGQRIVRAAEDVTAALTTDRSRPRSG